MAEVEAERFVGVDLGGTKILARMVEPSTGAAFGRVKTPTPAGPDAVIDAIVDAVTSLDGWEDGVGIGVGVPGFVDRNGVVAKCPNIAGWDHPVEVAARLSSRLSKPVVVANDVNCGAVAEHRLGAGRGTDDLLAVFVGTGVGGGLILDGRLVDGERGMAAEIGHVTVRPGGRPCGCGGLGHLESYAGRAGIAAEVRRRVADGATELLAELAVDGPIKSRHLARGLADDDPTTIELLADAADALAMALGNAATLLDLKLVILGGGVVDKLGEPFIDQIRQSSWFGGFGSSHVRLVGAHRVDDAGAIGAAALAADRLGGTAALSAGAPSERPKAGSSAIN